MIALSFSDGRDLIGATIPIRFRLTIALPTELSGVRCDVCWQRSSYLKEGDHRTYADVVSITIDDALWVRRSFQMAQDGKDIWQQQQQQKKDAALLGLLDSFFWRKREWPELGQVEPQHGLLLLARRDWRIRSVYLYRVAAFQIAFYWLGAYSIFSESTQARWKVRRRSQSLSLYKRNDENIRNEKAFVSL